jgi:hypothetical protein
MKSFDFPCFFWEGEIMYAVPTEQYDQINNDLKRLGISTNEDTVINPEIENPTDLHFCYVVKGFVLENRSVDQ